ncbi:four-carbon acid sugar kinase family protein [Desulfofundulus thermobenzoicus]|uniref:Four-carbon acid sugar kinase family protein n=1 Tax=Desulfofundulus thermobenzoicus TaxID=29376 RepID=A0A6N7IQ01_9FIRM|nr:four-carbon acid sugar kinase family protein [Desulfofundulus thermobenzoicus]MQL52060.1 four-carbon acid sugar kinase family protein [Desulfofundulus thermobenzoicus]
MNRICIIADDLTGSTDTGVQFSKHGLSTVVVFDYTALKDMQSRAAILSINAETRKMDEQSAYNRVREIVKLLRTMGFQYFYKKIDSTLRGNPAGEIEAIMDEMNQNLAFIAPSYPANGRIVENGYLYIKRQTGDKKDEQLFPLGYVPGLLERNMKRSLALIHLTDIRNGVHQLREKINELKLAGRQIFLMDAVTDEDLMIIALAIKDLAHNSVVAGSAGLAAWLPSAWGMVGEKLKEDSHKGALLFIAGTCNPVTAEQIREIQNVHSVQLVEMSTKQIIKGSAGEEIARVTAKIREYLSQGKITVLAVDTLLKNRNESYQTEMMTSNASKIARSLGVIAEQLTHERLVNAMVVAGGDTAVHVFNALGASGIILENEIAPGIPRGRLVGGQFHGLPVVTKAGGFGERDSLVTVTNHLTKKQEGWVQ